MFDRRKWGCRPAHRFSFVVILFPVLWFGSVTWAETSVNEGTGKHFLWSMKTQKNTVFLMGSIHVLKEDAYPLPEEIEKAYKGAERIVFETDVDQVKDPLWQAKMVGLGLYLDGQTLADHVSRETYGLLEKRTAAAGLPADTFDRFKPWLCALTVTVMEIQRLGFDSRFGIDTYFHDKAKRDGKEILALEPPEHQLSLFTTMSDREQEAFLRQTLEELEVTGSMAADMARAWKEGDADGIEAITGLAFKEQPDMYERFVVQRNRAWASTIHELAGQRGNLLVIVGAAHLVGRDSLLDLLEEKGYRIEQR